MIETTRTHSEDEREVGAAGIDSHRMRSELLSSLGALCENSVQPVFPGTDGLPEGFHNLGSRWANFDRFVAVLAERTLSGGPVRIAETEPRDHSRLPEDLARLSADHPTIAIPYIEAFDFLER